MLRDGQFLQEPPIKIGAHHAHFVRHELTDTELMIQDVLLGQKPRREKPSTTEVIALIVCCYAALAIVFGIVKGFDWITGN